MTSNESALRRLWRPRTIASVAVPLALVLILAVVDRVFILSQPRSVRWREPAHDGLVLAGALIAVYAVSAFTRALGGALGEPLGLARARAIATFISFVLYSVVILIAINGAGL